MHRRTVVVSVPALLAGQLGGCTGPAPAGNENAGAELPAARLDMEARSDADLAANVLYAIGAEDGPDPKGQLFEQILDGGTTVEKTRPPLPEGRHILYDETVYQLSQEVVEETPATRFSVKLDIVEGSISADETAEFAELPDVDREKFAARGLARGNTIGIGTTFLYTAAERNRSKLVPDPAFSYIVWDDGAQAKWVVDDATDVTLKTYRYTAEEVTDATTYGRQLRKHFTFTLSNLSDSQQEILERAINKRYVVDPEETPSSSFMALADRFRDHDRVYALNEDGEKRDGVSGSYLVQYDAEVYWTTLAIFGDALETPSPT